MNKNTYEEAKNRMSKNAMVFGLISFVISIVLCFMPYLSLPCASLAIIFAILSKGYSKSPDSQAIVGIVSGVLGITVSITVLFCVLISLKINPEYRNEVALMLNKLFSGSDMYPSTDFQELLNRFFG